MNKIDILKKILKDGYFKTTIQNKNNKNKKLLIDITTAGYILQAYNYASDKTKKRFNSFAWKKLAYIGFKFSDLMKEKGTV